MQQFFETLWNEILNTSTIEWFAVVSGVLYVIFATLKKMICWLFAFISSALYIYVCYSFQMYIESWLQVFYVIMAILGWWSWKKNVNQALQPDKEILDSIDSKLSDIKTWTLKKHVIHIAIAGVLSGLFGYLFWRFTDQKNPYTDAFTTIFSLGTTFMVVQKVLENWIYWVVIDVVSIYLYSSRSLQLSAVLYFIFSILAIIGFISWYKQMKNQRG